MNRVLVICTSFPPVNTTAIHRTLALVRHLRSRSVRVLVLTMSPPKELPVDERLLRRVPEDTEILRVPDLDLVAAVKRPVRAVLSLRRLWTSSHGGSGNGDDRAGHGQRPGLRKSLGDWVSSWLQLPDPRLGWLLRSRFRARQAVREFRPEVIYSTAPMWSAHVLGWLMHRMLGCPWVADCRDPWRANPYRRLRYGLQDRVDLYLEAQVVLNAFAVVCNTPSVRRDFVRRYAPFADKFHTITNGYDATLVAEVLSKSPEQTRQTLRLVHTGSFYGPRSPVPFFQAMAMLFREHPELVGRLKFVQVGENHYNHVPLPVLAGQFGVQDSLELVGSLGHHQALQAVQSGDVAIAASQDGSNSDLQVPRKFYEYYGLGKPILISGGACRIIREILPPGQAKNLYMVENIHPAELARVIGNIVKKWQQRELPKYSPPTVDLSEDRMARELEDLLSRAAAGAK